MQNEWSQWLTKLRSMNSTAPLIVSCTERRLRMKVGL